MTASPGPFGGLEVIDCARCIAAPAAGRCRHHLRGLGRTLGDVDDDPQMRAGGASVPFEHGKGLMVARPTRLDGAPQRRPASAPGLGQHGLAVLQAAGLSAGQAQQWVAQGVVRQQRRLR